MKPLSDLIYESEAGLIEPETTPLGNGGILAEEGVGIAIDPNAKPNGRPGMNIGGTPVCLCHVRWTEIYLPVAVPRLPLFH